MFNIFKYKLLSERIESLEKRIEELEKANVQLQAKKVKTQKIVKSEATVKKTQTNSNTSSVKKTVTDQNKTPSPGYLKKVKEMVGKVAKETGWAPEIAEAKFWEAKERTGCTPKEYYLYKFYEKTEEEQDTVLVADIQKHLQAKYGTNKKFIEMLYNKEATNKFFDKYIRRPWCVNTKISYEDFVEKFVKSNRIIYKPLDGNRGRGVEAFSITDETVNEVYEVLATYPDGVVEEYVVQHPAMLKLCPTSVNTIRVVTFSSNKFPVTQDGKHMDIAYASLRIGGGSAIVDNFHSGGMVSHIDLETGILITDAADMNCNVFEKHPATGVVFKGFEIPYFKQAIEMVTEAITKNKLEGYLGWDVAIAEDGPILIEVNDRPGVVLLSTPYAACKTGMKHVLSKYL